MKHSENMLHKMIMKRKQFISQSLGKIAYHEKLIARRKEIIQNHRDKIETWKIEIDLHQKEWRDLYEARSAKLYPENIDDLL